MSDTRLSQITSLHNTPVKRARTLLRRKGRQEERAFLVEGVRAIHDMLTAGVHPVAMYVDDLDRSAGILSMLPVPSTVRWVTREVLQSLSDVPEPQGMIAEVSMGSLQSEPQHDVWMHDLVVVADGVRDPGNMGTLIRTAAGAGVTQFLITPNSVDPFNPKCVRAAMGAHFRLSIGEMSAASIATALKPLTLIAITDAAGEQTYSDPDWLAPCAIIVGSEAVGPSREMLELATTSVRIPLERGVESLNAGVAGSHLVLEASRQRYANR